MTGGLPPVGADTTQEETPPLPKPHCVHLLMVHGVGRHDPLSSLLQVYQAFRANLRSPEAPVGFEDRIRDWRLEDVAEGAAPSYLKLVPDHPDKSYGIQAVYVYEVNYSALAGVVRENHRLDLTTLFVGLDMAVCASRLKLGPAVTTNLSGGRPAKLAKCLQRLTGVFAAATVPILGLPSLFFRNYTENIIAAFTRFFEDVATFALDRNGEQLISAHIDRTVENIVESDHFKRDDAPGELVIAAHSLGSVVAHHFLIRHWVKPTKKCVPRRLVTFGSPIGFITWLWLFLDFPDFDFSKSQQTGTNYFSWSTVSNATKPAQQLSWINVVNRLDPIATAFANEAVDLSRPLSEIEQAVGGGVIHRFCGGAAMTATGRAHTQYVHDRKGFIEILLQASGLHAEDPGGIETTDADTHWASTLDVLGRLRRILWLFAALFAGVYTALITRYVEDWRPLALTLFFLWPWLTIGGLAFFQRAFFGGPTKRIPGDRIDQFSRRDVTSIPYLIRRAADRFIGAPNEVDLAAPARPVRRTILQAVSFIPTVIAMAAPIVVGGWGRGWDAWPSRGFYLPGLIAFTLYLIACVLFELVSTWHAVLVEIGLGPRRPAPVTNNTPS